MEAQLSTTMQNRPKVLTAKYIRPWLYPKQLAALFHKKRYGLVEASTKAGKTTACLVWLAEQAMAGNSGNNYWWVAPVYPQAKIAYRRMKRALPKSLYKSNDTDCLVTLANGTMIWFKSGEKPDNLYGEDVFASVIDEASRLREEAWHAVRSTLTATKGPVRMIGNVRGRHNWFYKLSRKAEMGAQNMEYHKLISNDAVAAGVLSAAEIQDAKDTLPEQIFRELYEAEPSDDGGNPFGYSSIQLCISEMSNKPPKFWGIDLAKSTDWTVCVALDEDGSVCRYHRFQKPWLQTIDFIRENVKEYAFVDSTGVGDPVLESLQKNNFNFEGYHFSSNSKQQLMEGLALAIQRKAIRFPAGPIVIELEQFEYEITRTGVKYSAPQGMHDDCVCALALAQRRRTIPFAGSNLLDYYALKDQHDAAKKTATTR